MEVMEVFERFWLLAAKSVRRLAATNPYEEGFQRIRGSAESCTCERSILNEDWSKALSNLMNATSTINTRLCGGSGGRFGSLGIHDFLNRIFLN